MPSLAYWLITAGESVLGAVGIRTLYEQPAYRTLGHLPDQVEIRAYGPRTAIETPIEAGRDDQAFTRLFRYITGANRPDTPTGTTGGQSIAMTIPVERSPAATLRFFLPRSVAAAGPPVPTDPLVRIVALPPETIAVRRFTGAPSPAGIARQDGILRAAIAVGGWRAVGATARFGYDPPFTPPFLRRNEVAVKLEK